MTKLDERTHKFINVSSVYAAPDVVVNKVPCSHDMKAFVFYYSPTSKQQLEFVQQQLQILHRIRAGPCKHSVDSHVPNGRYTGASVQKTYIDTVTYFTPDF